MQEPRLFEEITTKSGDAIVFADPDGRIQFWNAAAADTFGYAEDEALTESLDIIIPEPFRDRHWEGYDRAMERGATSYERGERLAVPALRKDGQRISVEFTVTLVHDEDGTLAGIAAIVRDVTDTWETSEQRKERIEELEDRVTELEAELSG